MSSQKKADTKVVTAGRHPKNQFGAVNPPVLHASTILFETVKDLKDYENAPVKYGRHGTPSTFCLQEAVAELEGGYDSLLAPSGLAAVTTAILSFVNAGDHILMVDATYDPTRSFCDSALKRFGVSTTYYDPLIGQRIDELIQPNTKVVFVESPGSRTFEVQDIPAIAAAAKAKGDVTVIMDNTWASPLYFKPFEHGADVSVQAATKYIVGHSDAMLGVITTTEEAWEKVYATNRALGGCAGPDDAYLAQRGFRTLSVRLERHNKNALALIDWLLQQPEVSRILYPGHPDDPGHELWKRDFLGASGLFGVVFNQGTMKQGYALLDSLKQFGMGYSWGGFESLMIPNIGFKRVAKPWKPEGLSYRIHAGLEDPEDLIADLDQAFKVFRETK
jgi:cystathionine beta-lyase